MGVRGKIEAVLYASEEPVTLAQLSVLFGEEALAEPPEQDQPEQEPPEQEPPEQEQPEQEQPDLPDLLVAAEQAVADEVVSEQPEASAEDSTAAAEPSASEADADAEEKQQARAARQREKARREAVRSILDALVSAYAADDRGMEIREIAGGYRVATKPEYHDAVRSFAKSLKPPMKLSLQALETLAVIAYKQPVTAPEVSEIRGVDSGGVLGSLIGRKLVTTAGRKQVLGRPILYKTTKEFLLRFGLRDLNELPSMEEFEKMAGELRALADEPEPAAEHEPPLERPDEPELSLIVEEEAPEELPGVQVQKGGGAVSDAEAVAAESEEHGG